MDVFTSCLLLINTKWGKFAIAEKAIEENENETVESQLVSGVKDELVRAGRRFPPQFIANVLLSVHQNTFTILAGPPGSGKTSFARLLTSALVPCERCREISVSRGWTSFKDLIGFSNPLTQKFHESNTELYSLLQQLDYECTEDTARQSPLAFVILDEANLSPIEHYWSIFYNRTDNFCTDTYMTLSFGGDERLQYANNIRFIGTINTDMTTEQLSPRILDRVNVIRMPELDSSNFMNSPDDFYEPAPVNSTGMSLDQVIEIFDLPDFKNKSKYQVQNAVYEQFLKLIEPLRKVGIRVSPRLKVAAQRFLSAAERYINDEMKPLDYFVAQRILPQLSVQGEEYLPHLKSIRSACHL